MINRSSIIIQAYYFAMLKMNIYLCRSQKQLVVMNWKLALFWLLSAAFIFYYLLMMGVFSWVSQEETQLFIPRWWAIKDTLFEPGGFCAVVGQWIVQYYRQPMLAVILHTSMFIGCGLMVSRLLRGSLANISNSLLALIPFLYLASMSVRSEYLVDGTVGIVLMIMLLSFAAMIRNIWHIAGFGIISTLLLCWLSGYLSLFYAMLYILFALLNNNSSRQRWAASACLIPALFIFLYGDLLAIPVPLWDGWKSEAFIEVQRLPHYYIYRVWTIFTILLAAVAILSHLALEFVNGRKWAGRSFSLFSMLLLLLSGCVCLPNSSHLQRIMFDELAFMYREKQWNVILNKYRGKQVTNYLALNYINMSLAQQGELANQMFMFDQRGVKGLCSDWDHTFYTDRLLSDIHFLAGSLSLSESFAMDGFTQAKRKGSATMMQRMVQLSLLRGEMELARKYLGLLADMPYYEDWAREYHKYLDNPELIEMEPELMVKGGVKVDNDRLLASLPFDSLWGDSVDVRNNVAWEYRGCYYLLDKRLDDFAKFIKESPLDNGEPLPRYFQEALVMSKIDSDLITPLVVNQDIEERYSVFKQMLMRLKSQVDISTIYSQFGDTYWFYFYFKNIKEDKR